MTQSEPASVMPTRTSGKEQRHHRPAAFGAWVHVQEVDHVHDDLDDAEA